MIDLFLAAITLSMVRLYIYILHSNEQRPYLVEIPDPVFKYLPIYDTSWPCAIILYFCAGHFVWHSSEVDLELCCWTFILLMIARCSILWLHPFRGHHTMIPLRDPIIDCILNVGSPLIHDCSFSGHCSTLVALGFLMPSQSQFFWWSAAITAILLVLSRVHYTADCVIAPVVAHFCFRLAHEFHQYWPSLSSWPLAILLCAFLHAPPLFEKATIWSNEVLCLKLRMKGVVGIRGWNRRNPLLYIEEIA